MCCGPAIATPPLLAAWCCSTTSAPWKDAAQPRLRAQRCAAATGSTPAKCVSWRAQKSLCGIVSSINCPDFHVVTLAVVIVQDVF